MKARELARIARLVALSERRRDEVAVALRRARARAASAAEAHARAEECYAEAVLLQPAVASSHDLAVQHRYLRDLDRAVQHTEAEQSRFHAVEDAARERVTEAQRDVRKLECWAESVKEAVDTEAERREARLDDERAGHLPRRSDP
ncbi:MAG: flagellar FliJ family protein [Myxococcales bacterium]|nr:flagellar FliJ family protein [Myxococcales bacterium]